MKKGVVFSIEEFSVYDGPGIRTTVFFKGCPMRCNWCHNPEGLEVTRQVLRNPNGCAHCGRCREVCPHPESCTLCGACVRACPRNLIRISGTEYTSEELAAKLSKNLDILNANGGGVTFSGGECMIQADFLIEVLARLSGKTHLAIQTCGDTDSAQFRRALGYLQLVMFDLKLLDGAAARKFTGCGVEKILQNFEVLNGSGVPFIVRVPLIPGVTDTEDNLTAIADKVKGSNAECVELLPYNQMAGSKYALMGRSYTPLFDASVPPKIDTALFEKKGIRVKVY